MVKNRKIALSIFTALILSMMVVSATGFIKICLREGESIAFSECNPDMTDYVCEKDRCEICANEVSSGVYCPASPQSCQDACVYLYESDDEDSTVTLVSPDPDITLEPGNVDFSFYITMPNRLERCDLYLNEKREKYTK